MSKFLYGKGMVKSLINTSSHSNCMTARHFLSLIINILSQVIHKFRFNKLNIKKNKDKFQQIECKEYSFNVNIFFFQIFQNKSNKSSNANWNKTHVVLVCKTTSKKKNRMSEMISRVTKSFGDGCLLKQAKDHWGLYCSFKQSYISIYHFLSFPAGHEPALIYYRDFSHILSQRLMWCESRKFTSKKYGFDL